MSKQGEGFIDPVMTFEEIGQALGITRSGAWMAYKSAMRKLRQRRRARQLDELRALWKSKGQREATRL